MSEPDKLCDESQIQAAYVEWCEAAAYKHPELKKVYHVPNGEYRNPRTGAHLKRLGVKRGIPDISLDVARGAYHGLRIEFKATGGRLTKEQKEYIDFLKSEGYAVYVCYSVDSAMKVTEAYLRGKRWNQNDLLAWISEKQSKK